MKKTKAVCKMLGLKYPASDKIESRSSTVARSMACTIAQRIPCSLEQATDIANELGVDPNKPTCVYCGRTATNLDHLHPLINNIFPTGYITEPNNLVPCCSACNQKKGSLEWQDYMSNFTEFTNKDGKMEERYNRLTIFTAKFPAQRIEYEMMNGFKEMWQGEYQKINDALSHAQAEIEKFKNQM